LRDGLAMYLPWYLRTWCPRKSKPLSTQVMTVFSCESSSPRSFQQLFSQVQVYTFGLTVSGM
jgi:uncharacterized membrane protein YgaE (UPF0421/DUF939 family)